MNVSGGSKHNISVFVDVRPLLKSAEVAHILGISIKSVHKLVRDKKLACVQDTAGDRRSIYELYRKGRRNSDYTEPKEASRE